MSRTVKLKSIKEDKAVINFHVNLDARGATGYETDVIVRNVNEIGIGCPRWVAEMRFDNMPPQETPEDAIERMGLYLVNMAKAMKGKNIKHLNVGGLFKAVSK